MIKIPAPDEVSWPVEEHFAEVYTWVFYGNWKISKESS
jgi:hypothetical protein